MIKLTGGKRKGYGLWKEKILEHNTILSYLGFLTHEELLALKKLLQKVK